MAQTRISMRGGDDLRTWKCGSILVRNHCMRMPGHALEAVGSRPISHALQIELDRINWVGLGDGRSIMKAEVTVDLFRQVMAGYEFCEFSTANIPVIMSRRTKNAPILFVKFSEAQEFAERLSIITGQNFTLPTEGDFLAVKEELSGNNYSWTQNRTDSGDYVVCSPASEKRELVSPTERCKVAIRLVCEQARADLYQEQIAEVVRQAESAVPEIVLRSKRPKVLLVSPGRAVTSAQHATPSFVPIGAISLATYLRANEVDARIVDLQVEDPSLVRDQISDFGPDLVGFGAMTTSIHSTLELASEIKDEFGVPIVFGGVHPSARPQHTLSQPQVDYVVSGEGEFALEELAHLVVDDGRPRNTWGLYAKRISRPTLRNCMDLAKQPFPDYELVDVGRYIEDSINSPAARPSIEMIISRGCSFLCSFCAVEAILGKKWRAFHPEVVVQQMEKLMQRYKVADFYFKDSTFTMRRSWIERFAAEIARRRLNVGWTANARVETLFRPRNSLNLNTEMIDLMVASGLKELWFGLETGSLNVAETLNKRINHQQIFTLFEYLKNVGVRRSGYFIVGFPSETHVDIDVSIRFARSLGLDETHWHIFQPYPGTPLGEKLRAEGRLPNEEAQWSNMAFDQANFDFILSREEIQARFQEVSSMQF